MSNYDELIGILKELLFNRFLPEPKIIKGLLGDGTGVVRVPGRKDFNYARFNRGSTESFEVFNKTVPEVNDWPILISELPWQPGLTQVVGTDWESYIQSGWGDSVSTSNPHAPTHVWRDGYIGSDPLDIYMRAIAPGRAYSSSSTGSVVFVNSFEYHTGTIWPGVPGVDLSPLMISIPTGTARFAGVYVNPVSNSLGVVTGNTSVDTQAFDPPLVTFPFGTIPIARIRLYGGQGGLLENDFRDARRLFDVPATGTSSNGSPTGLAGGDLTGSYPDPRVAGLFGYSLVNTQPQEGQVLMFTGSAWRPIFGAAWKLGDTIVVSNSGDGDYTDIQTAIDAASSGDVILIDHEVWGISSTLTIDKSITLRGISRAKVGGTYLVCTDDVGVEITGNSVVLQDLSIVHAATTTTAIAVKSSSNQLNMDNCIIDQTGSTATTVIALNVVASIENIIQDCEIIVDNATNKYGILADTGASVSFVLHGKIDTDGGTDIATNNAGANIILSVVTMETFAETLGSIEGVFIHSTTGALHSIGATDYIDQEEISTPSNPSTGRWRIYPKTDGYYQLDDAGAETKLGGVTDAQYYVAALHAGLSAEIVPSLDTFKVSKLAASDGSPDPAWSVGATGILTTNSERLDMDGKAIILDADGDTYFAGDVDDQITYVISSSQAARMDTGGLYITRIAEAAWFDFPLQDVNDLAGVASHFRDNTSTYPTGWTESDAPAATNTNANYSFWKILGTSSDTAWGYNRQTSINLESESANAWTTFMVGPILLKDGRYSADISYHFGIYRNNAGAIDTATYSRMRIWWDSATSLWKLVAEERDGSTAHSTTLSLDQNPLQPLYLAFTVQNAAAKNTRQMWGSTPIIGAMRTNAQAPTSAPTWGQMWVRFHQSRGAGVTDAISIGALDYLGSVIE